jgi:flagella basal body P-ring formation protein FlgA
VRIAILLLAHTVQASDLVVVHLLPEIATTKRIVTTTDIAEISGGDPAIRREIERLDMADVGPEDHDAISRWQVLVRLTLAGIPSESYTLAGAEETWIRRGQSEINDAVVIEAARESLAEHWKLESRDLSVQLAAPLPIQIDEWASDIDDLRIRAFVEGTMQPGRLTVTMGLYDEDRLVRTFPAQFHAAVPREVAILTRSVRRGDTIASDMIEFQHRELVGANAFSVAGDAVGKVATRNLRVGDYLKTSDIEIPSTAAVSKAVTVIKKRDFVRVFVRSRGLMVTVPRAQALDDGDVGDLIRVKNLQSSQIITGRVVDANAVEASL